MPKHNTYPNIDMQQTGRKMKRMLETAGYTPRMIQDYLQATQKRYVEYYNNIYGSVASIALD